MAYRLKSGEPVLHGLKRIVAEEASASATVLHSHDRRQRDKAIHESRKSVKKIRGLLRLIEPGASRWFRQHNNRARNIGRLLSEFRDAAVMLETAAQLRERVQTGEQRAALQNVSRALSRDRRMLEKERGVAKSSAEAAQEMAKFGSAFDTELERAVTSEGFPSIAAGLRKTYRSGRRALGEAQGHPSAIRFHEFRKRVKDRWYQTRLLEEFWDKDMQRQEKQLKRLETLLGEDHNIQVLKERIAADPARYGGEEAREAFLELARPWQEQLRNEALRLSGPLYEQKPRAYLSAVSKLWSESTAVDADDLRHDRNSLAKKKAARSAAGAKPRRGAAA